jgi:hypothetical protein
MNKPRDVVFPVDPTRLVFDATQPDGASTRVHNARSPSPWAVVEVQLPWNATEVVVMRPHSSPQPLNPSIDGVATFIVLRDALYARSPTLLRYNVSGTPIEHRIALEPGPPAE